MSHLHPELAKLARDHVSALRMDFEWRFTAHDLTVFAEALRQQALHDAADALERAGAGDYAAVPRGMAAVCRWTVTS